jgi:DNA repair photolyase
MSRPASNPRNPLLARWLEHFEPPLAELEITEEEARSALSKNDSPDLPFRWSLNPYRGCQHACAYCYARPTHQYLGLGAGTDFDRRIVVKTNIAELLRDELRRPRWQREAVVISGVTDPYQPLEARYGLTRRCLEVCLAQRTPVTLITKGAVVRRDLDVLAELANGPGARVYLSIPFLDPELARALEPGAPSPAHRLETLAQLHEVGVPTGLAVAPVIPHLGEAGLAGLIARAAEAGATTAFHVLLRLPAEVLPVFRERLEAALPGRVEAILAALTEMRSGRLQESRFGARMRGRGARYDAFRSLFELLCRKHGLSHREDGDDDVATPQPRQGLLFEDEGADGQRRALALRFLNRAHGEPRAT